MEIQQTSPDLSAREVPQSTPVSGELARATVARGLEYPLSRHQAKGHRFEAGCVLHSTTRRGERLPGVSRDIFVQDIPEGITTVDEIPDDWEPRPLPFGHSEVVAAVLELGPDADTSDPEWMHVNLAGVDVEVNVANVSPLGSFALHVRAADPGHADAFIGRLLERLGVRAFDSESASGIFQH
jgi:hypothetical protein